MTAPDAYAAALVAVARAAWPPTAPTADMDYSRTSAADRAVLAEVDRAHAAHCRERAARTRRALALPWLTFAAGERRFMAAAARREDAAAAEAEARARRAEAGR